MKMFITISLEGKRNAKRYEIQSTNILIINQLLKDIDRTIEEAEVEYKSSFEYH